MAWDRVGYGVRVHRNDAEYSPEPFQVAAGSTFSGKVVEWCLKTRMMLGAASSHWRNLTPRLLLTWYPTETMASRLNCFRVRRTRRWPSMRTTKDSLVAASASNSHGQIFCAGASVRPRGQCRTLARLAAGPTATHRRICRSRCQAPVQSTLSRGFPNGLRALGRADNALRGSSS